MNGSGTVYLVGAGPGDPGLLTRRGARLLRRADAVVYDALVDRRVLDLAPPRAERIDAGKRAGRWSPGQDRINGILIAAARRLRVVVRLKGGDPFVYGRGGEEALALARAGIRVEVIPGVTAALGAAAGAGIPLTHRGVAASVVFETGSRRDGAEAGRCDPGGPDRTRVFYMATRKLATLARRLIEDGLSPTTPAALVESASLPSQRTVVAPLAELADRCRQADAGPPAVIIVGNVVGLRERIAWWDRRPLSGRRMVVARARAQPSRLAARLTELGAETLSFPRLEASPLPLPERLLDSLERWDWVVLTSVAAVDALFASLDARGADARALAATRVTACGRAVVRALRRRGIAADVGLRTYAPATVADRMAARGPLAGARVLHPTRSGAESGIAHELRCRGATVTPVVAYRQIVRPTPGVDVVGRVVAGDVEAIVFGSSSSVRRYVDAAGGPVVGRAVVAAIGPDTARAALAYGLPVHMVPRRHTIDGLVEMLADELGHGMEETDGVGTDAAAGRARVAARS